MYDLTALWILMLVKFPRSVWFISRDIIQRAYVFNQSVEFCGTECVQNKSTSSVPWMKPVQHLLPADGRHLLNAKSWGFGSAGPCIKTKLLLMLTDMHDHFVRTWFFKKIWSLQPIFVIRHNINIYFCLYGRKKSHSNTVSFNPWLSTVWHWAHWIDS